MNSGSGDTFSYRLVLFLILLALFGSFIAGVDYAEDVLPDDSVHNPHQTDIVALFYNKCQYVCSLSYSLCTSNNPYKSPFRDTVCRAERESCNTTCVQSHTLPA